MPKSKPELMTEKLEECLEKSKNILTEDFKKAYYAILGYDLNRASGHIKRVIEGKLDPMYLGYIYYDTICGLSDRAAEKCLLLHLASKGCIEGYAASICRSATGLQIKPCTDDGSGSPIRLDWIWKFCTGAGTEPVDAPKAIETAVDIIKESMGENGSQASHGALARKMLEKFNNAKKIYGHLKNVGATLFTYWLALAYPERFIPFDTAYCQFFSNKDECEKDLGDPSRFVEYYVLFLDNLHKIIREMKPNILETKSRFDKGKVRDLIELHAALRVLQDSGQCT